MYVFYDLMIFNIIQYSTYLTLFNIQKIKNIYMYSRILC